MKCIKRYDDVESICGVLLVLVVFAIISIPLALLVGFMIAAL